MKKIKTQHYFLSFCLLAFLLIAVKAFSEDNPYSNPEVAKGIKQYAEIYLGNDATNIMGNEGGGGNFSVANIIAWVIFGGVGFIAFVYGKKMSLWRPLVIGIVLSIYPYFVSNTLVLYGVGMALCALLFFWRE